MSAEARPLGSSLLRCWRRLSRWPGGAWLFSLAVGWIAPYSGTTGARVRELEPGRAVLLVSDRRRLRNHLDSIHAVALANAAELASGLAMLTALPPGTRAIVTGVACTYEKKARGTITVRGDADPPREISEPTEALARATLRDEAGDVVARFEATWLLAPRETS